MKPAKKPRVLTAQDREKTKGLYKRNGTWWLSRQRQGKRVFVSLQTSEYSVAITRAKEIEDNPELNPGGRLQAEIERYCKVKAEAGEHTRASQSNSHYMLQSLLQYLGDVTPGSVTAKQAQGYYEHLRQSGKSSSTVRSYFARARTLFAWFHRQQMIRTNPFIQVKVIRHVPVARKEFCRASLRNQLIDSAPTDELKFILYCGFHVGMRRNEIVEARPCWFDLELNLVSLRKLSPRDAEKMGLDEFDLKDREERTVPLSKAFAAFLREWLKPGDDYCLAPKARRGKNRYRFDFRRSFNTYMDSQGCGWVTAHTMRRTFASLHATAGTPLYHIAKWLGDDISTTQHHYAHLAPDTGVFEKGIG